MGLIRQASDNGMLAAPGATPEYLALLFPCNLFGTFYVLCTYAANRGASWSKVFFPRLDSPPNGEIQFLLMENGTSILTGKGKRLHKASLPTPRLRRIAVPLLACQKSRRSQAARMNISPRPPRARWVSSLFPDLTTAGLKCLQGNFSKANF